MIDYYYKKEKKLNKKTLLLIILLLFFGPGLIIFSLKVFFDSPIGNTNILNPLREIVEQKTFASPVGNIAERNLTNGRYAVFVEDLNTSDAYSLNKKEKFESASLYKLWVMAVVVKRLDEGSLSPDEVLSSPKIDLDKTLGLVEKDASISGSPSPSSSPEPEDFVTIALGDALTKMITVSDNYSALLLVNKIGATSVSKFLKDNGLTNSSFGSPPKTTAEDIAKFYRKLYNKEFVGSNQMIELLKHQQINDRIPKFLPENLEIAHKTGELNGNKHDAGIVFTKTGDYIIVVLSDTNSEKVAAEKIADFSRDLYLYFNP